MEEPDVTLAFPATFIQCGSVDTLEVDVVLNFTPWFLVIPSPFIYQLHVQALRQRPSYSEGGIERTSKEWQELVQIPHPVPACIYSDLAPRVKLGVPEKVRKGTRLQLHLLNTAGMSIMVNPVLLGKR